MKSHSATSRRLPDFVEPMKAKLVDSIRPGDWIYEIKFDGYRALALRGGSETRVLSRNQKDLGSQFPEVQRFNCSARCAGRDHRWRDCSTRRERPFVLSALQALRYGHRTAANRLLRFRFARSSTAKDLQNLPIEERKAKLEELLKKAAGVIRYSVSFTKDIEELLDRAQDLGLEGLIGKRSGSRYEAGKRTGAWIKIKLHLSKNS